MPSSVCLSGFCCADGADSSGGVGEVGGARAPRGVGAPRLRTIHGQCCVSRLPVHSAGGIPVARAKISLLPVLIFENPSPAVSAFGFPATKRAEEAGPLSLRRKGRRRRMLSRNGGAVAGRDVWSGVGRSADYLEIRCLASRRVWGRSRVAPCQPRCEPWHPPRFHCAGHPPAPIIRSSHPLPAAQGRRRHATIRAAEHP